MSRASHLQPRVCEWALAIYFVYTSAVALLLPIFPDVRLRTLIANLVAIGALAWLSTQREGSKWALVRNLLPLLLVMLAYQQMGWFALPHDGIELELSWVLWDKLLLNDLKLQAAIEIAGPLLPGLLEITYVLTYILGPFGIAVIAATGNLRRADHFLAIYVISAILSYALFPYFPSEPPRALFPGEDFPNYDTVFRRFNWWLLAGGGIHTSVFPSGHVSSAFGAALGLLYALPSHRKLGFTMLGIACGIAVSTVYGRYHYAVDAIAGIAVSLVAFAGCVWLFNRRRLGRISHPVASESA